MVMARFTGPSQNSMKPDKLTELAQLLEGAEQLREYRRWNFFKPYPKQRQFLAMGRTHRERLFMAANPAGKSETGAFEAACHLTGIYPSWWEGHRFARPVKMWAAGMTSLETRDVLQT